MKKNLFLKNLMVALLLLMGMSAWAVDEVLVYTLTSTAGSNNSYASNCDIAVNGITWNLTGNSQMIPWRLGGKSISNIDRALYSKTPMDDDIIKVVVENGSASSITVNSFKLIVSTGENGGGTITDEITGTFIAGGNTTFNKPNGHDWSNKYFKFVYNVTVSVNSNKFVEFKNAKFYKEAMAGAPVVPTISLTAGTYTSEQTVTLATETEGAEIHYTLDGTDPTSSSALYTTALVISETCTLKAIAIKDGIASDINSASYVFIPTEGQGTKANPYTVADVQLLNNCGNNAWVIGTVIGSYDSNRNNAFVTDCTVNSNIVLAIGTDTVPVALPAGNIRTNLNLRDHPHFLGITIKVKGDLVSYFSRKGVKNTSDYEIMADFVSISAAGYATYFNSANAYTMPDDCEGYVFFDGALEPMYEGGDNVPAGEPLVIYTIEPGTKTLEFITINSLSLKAQGYNLLDGTDEETALTADDDYYFYGLSLNAAGELNSVGFYWMNANGAAFTNGAHKAYLKLAKSAGAPERILFNQNPVATDIDNAAAIKATKALVNGNIVIIRNGAKFNLNGMLVK